ncbi:Mitochondrial oxaloacetate carrier protein [Yamadazyma tenuis]|uniref:Mitochondrial thiamine pyrophosphate carrier 1 n=1 Tax=Candida tenuis (strain ATCC 10573 / BCRC 21748 / CBS 615 / JCM 9827 / NBRC 10315 / NRRL Y-1498 / VKM Y-70) TaxID=590646 RepID=G3B780_CANTC|nr:mitochondrial carrier [Yamadazyma tenuis ATCC 10573]EGV61586.1 mitochondrial carrier [Yamadazyma tenuis ATCC 10573]WEJ92810.1 Mitochondrial oxaloacetate carrier protein [Yamadazyma tenuis]
MSKHKETPQVSTAGGFVAGALAACGAVTFTNPIELIKTRMQLQGELTKVDKNAVKIYKNPFQAFGVIYKNEGLRGLQKGLVAGYFYQIGLNGCRFGFYEPARYNLTKLFNPTALKEGEKAPQSLGINVAAGFISGTAGATIANPLFLVKTRMQSYSAVKNASGQSVAVGQQTFYRSPFEGLKKIFKAEGIKGLFRGVDAAILRTGAGSSTQLPSYFYAKSLVIDNHIVAEDSILVHLIASSVAGLAVAVMMNPWDVVLTRVYNQKGDLYSGVGDCIVKTVKTEGITAFYKGFWAQLFRIGPHSILSLMFMEQSVKLVAQLESYL